LMYGNRQVGAYRYSTKTYWILYRGKWSAGNLPLQPPALKEEAQKPVGTDATGKPACHCCENCRCDEHCQCAVTKPCDPACFCATTVADLPLTDPNNFGLDRSKLNGGDDKHVTNTDDTIPNDTSRHTLVVVTSNDALAKAVIDTFNATPYVAVFSNPRTYHPDHWHLRPFKLSEDTEFQKSKFAIFVEEPPDGTNHSTIHPFYSFDAKTFPTLLSGIGSLRQVDPNYDPNKSRPVNSENTLQPIHWCCIGIAAFLLLGLRRQPTQPN